MEYKKLLPLSIIILSISIVFSSIWLGHSLKNNTYLQIKNNNQLKEKALLTEKESAEYLNISLEEFKSILSTDTLKKKGLTSYSTYKFVPYIEINDGTKMFSKKELDEWIKYNMYNK